MRRLRLLVLCKRHPMGRDLIERPFGRFYHLAKGLQELGHSVLMVLAHQRGADCFQGHRHGLDWITVDPLAAPWKIPSTICRVVEEYNPDWIFGLSDTYYGIAAVSLAQRFGARSLLDAYDNYASYVPWAAPLHTAWFRAAAKADVVTVAGPTIAELIASRGRRDESHIVPMALDSCAFQPMPQQSCRVSLRLPLDCTLMGYFGTISRQRGIQVLFDAYRNLRSNNPSIRLVLSGRLHRGVRVPPEAIYLGYVADELLPELYNAMDLVAVLNRDSDFGNYSYPIKLYEAMACQCRLVVSRTASTAWILRDTPSVLVEPGDSGALAIAIIKSLDATPPPYPAGKKWLDLASTVADLLI